MNRFRIAWRVLRGHTVMYRCALVLNGQQLYVTSQRGGPVTVVDNAAGGHFTGAGEVAVIDWNTSLIYARNFTGRLP